MSNNDNLAADYQCPVCKARTVAHVSGCKVERAGREGKWVVVRSGLHASGVYQIQGKTVLSNGYTSTRWVLSYKGVEVRTDGFLKDAKRTQLAFAAQLAKGLVSETGELLQPSHA